MPAPRAFADLHAQARRFARRPEEADDLVQSALLAALESGRTDLAAPETRRWLFGVIRNRAAFDARTAIRRKRRESQHVGDSDSLADSPAAPVQDEAAAALHALSPALRLTALLALNGCTRREIAWLLNLSDAALRQRLSQLRRALAGAGLVDADLLTGPLAYGRLRRALLAPAHLEDRVLASHDPDGHLFVIGRSQIPLPRQQGDRTSQKE